MGFQQLYRAIKHILIFVNFIFWTVGIIAVGLAIWMLVDQTFLVTLSQDKPHFYAGLCVFLTAGIIMFIIAFLGCCGAFQESQCMLVGFSSCLLIIIVAQIATGAWLYMNSNKLEELIESNIYTSIKTEYGSIKQRTEIVDAFQQYLHCCGAYGPNDWAVSKYSNNDAGQDILLTVSQGTIFKIPKSCCKKQESFDCQSSLSLRVADKIPPTIFNIGCTDKILGELKTKSNIFISIIVGLNILEFIGLIFSLILCCAIGSNRPYKA
ncbi:CD9 antigen-like [Phymastichus coffea]|uniref:CD9 antigen-like n=1 Tax=Phymastichus coffea TaxID=108790 RepID=UPI00273A9AB4|nr:CD9 antigen-like [Phymastichus coffea]XP_058805069.1 CD9 antigen-like [Phymastichus coffea]